MKLEFLEYNNLFIFDQLQMEEALLRTSDKNYCIVNSGTKPAVVMGISAKSEEMLEPSFFEQDEIALIRRYSGGGTVVVDETTFFVTFIFNKNEWDSAPFPEAIMRSLEPLVSEALPGARLHQNDFVIGREKCGGNAQMITKERFVHHISFLWDYEPSRMNYLAHPKKKPAYRGERIHSEFLCPLKKHFSWEELPDRFKKACSQLFEVEEGTYSQTEEVHRQATELLQV